ncbi:MAG: DUF1638 domain-containing protein [Eubacteriales bacterium]|nr:DUF1638 domain-containing protein [Clostridiales bacterium]MDO5544374.1 DUF1638 domain-containing protein [Eubacteriales bacterium]
MSDWVITCKTVEKELLTAIERTGCQHPVRWVESGLHNWPDKLNARLQAELDACDGCENVLLAMGFCGNSVLGLHTHDFKLVIPRCDDCITLLLGSDEARKQQFATYFLTEGWLKGEKTIWQEYQVCLKKYGEKRGRRIFSVMLRHYEKMAYLDTGCTDDPGIAEQIQMIAKALELSYVHLDGSLDYLSDLLSGRWDPGRFLVVPPHSTISQDMLIWKGKKHEGKSYCPAE